MAIASASKKSKPFLLSARRNGQKDGAGSTTALPACVAGTPQGMVVEAGSVETVAGVSTCSLSGTSESARVAAREAKNFCTAVTTVFQRCQFITHECQLDGNGKIAELVFKECKIGDKIRQTTFWEENREKFRKMMNKKRNNTQNDIREHMRSKMLFGCFCVITAEKGVSNAGPPIVY